MRARIAGKWSRPIVELADEITRATQVLAECGPDLMVYNCTASSMKEGPSGERRILDIMHQAAAIEAVSTSALVAEALRTLKIKSVVLISPYQNNDDIVNYLRAIGVSVVSRHRVAPAGDRIRKRVAAALVRDRGRERPARRRRNLLELRGDDPDRSRCADRAGVEQAGGEQQSSGALGLPDAPEIAARRYSGDARARQADANARVPEAERGEMP